MRLLTEYFLESRDVPGLGHIGFRLDSDNPAQAVIAAQLSEHGLGRDMPQRDPQDDHSPEHGHRVVIATFAPRTTERVEQLAVGE